MNPLPHIRDSPEHLNYGFSPYAVAIHEAGHALARLKQGLSFHSIALYEDDEHRAGALHPTEKTLDISGPVTPPSWTPDFDECWPHARGEIMSLLGGTVARLVFSRPLTHMIMHEARNDFQWIDLYLDTLVERSTDNFLSKFLIISEVLIDLTNYFTEHKATLERIAGALVEKKTLTYQEVYDLWTHE